MFLKATEKREHGDALYFLGEIEKIQGNFRTAEDYFARSVASGSTTGKYLKNAYWDSLSLLNSAAITAESSAPASACGRNTTMKAPGRRSKP
jgi:hypothetical protein